MNSPIKNKNNMEQLILDYEQWRCGGSGKHSLGTEYTALLNGDGYMCCLGQFCLQHGLDVEDIYNKGLPKSIIGFAPTESLLTIRAFVDGAVDINDNDKTLPKTKIKQLTKLCLKYGYELVVLNQPD